MVSRVRVQRITEAPSHFAHPRYRSPNRIPSPTCILKFSLKQLLHLSQSSEIFVLRTIRKKLEEYNVYSCMLDYLGRQRRETEVLRFGTDTFLQCRTRNIQTLCGADQRALSPLSSSEQVDTVFALDVWGQGYKYVACC